MEPVNTLLVSFVDDLLIVGRKAKGDIPEIINAIKGDDAVRLYKELTTKKVSEK